MAKKTFLSGICNSRCFYAHKSRCKCRCHRVYHGLGVKKATELTDVDKEALRKINPTLIIDFTPIATPKEGIALPQETKWSMGLALMYARYEKGDIRG